MRAGQGRRVTRLTDTLSSLISAKLFSRSLLSLFLLVAFGTGLAQRCGPELVRSAAQLPPETPTGVLAAQLMARAVILAEPALPPLDPLAKAPLAEDQPGYSAANYLAQRELLPASWQPEELSRETWEAMLNSFLDWYDLPPTQAGAGTALPDLVGDLGAVLDSVNERIQPLLLVASDSENRAEVAFLGMLWNWTVYPRLIVLKPKEEHTLERGVAPLLDRVGTCAIDLRHYVLAPEQTARSLFLAHADARMYVIGSEPERLSWPLLVDAGEEELYFGFEAAEVEELQAFAAAFDGNQVGVRTLVTMLPRLRTNLPPTRIPGILRTPAN